MALHNSESHNKKGGDGGYRDYGGRSSGRNSRRGIEQRNGRNEVSPTRDLTLLLSGLYRAGLPSLSVDHKSAPKLIHLVDF